MLGYGYSYRLLPYYIDMYRKELREVQNKVVTIVGTGILGSNVASLIAKFNPRKMVLVDPDTVGRENVGYQRYSVHDIGIPKPKALARTLIAEHPYLDYRVEVIACPLPAPSFGFTEEELLESIDLFDELIRESDIVLLLVDRKDSRRIGISFAATYRKPIVSAGGIGDSVWVSSWPGRGDLVVPLCIGLWRSYSGYTASSRAYAINPIVAQIAASTIAWITLMYLAQRSAKPYHLAIYIDEDNDIRIHYREPDPCTDRPSRELLSRGFRDLRETLSWLINSDLW